MLLADRKTRANPEAMRNAASVLGVSTPTTRGAKADAELLGALRLEIGKRLKNISEDDHVKCVVCEEISTEDTDVCPYCGDEGSASESEALQIASSKKPAAKVAAAADEDESESEDESEEVEDSIEEEESEDESEESDEDEDEDESDEDEESDEEDSEDESGESDEDEASDESVGIAEGAVVAKNTAAAMKGLSKQLDASLARIAELKRSAVTLSYDIGIECRTIRDQQLFKARGYSSFKAFAEKELPFTRESALQLVAIVEKHSREDYEQIGFSKMRVISAVSDTATKAELIEAARGGATTKELGERAAAAGGRKKPGKVPTPAAEKGERITLLGKIGKKHVLRFQNTENGEAVPAVGTFHAKGFTPSVHAELEVSDGVFFRIGLRLGSKNELEGLTCRFVRAE